MLLRYFPRYFLQIAEICLHAFHVRGSFQRILHHNIRIWCTFFVAFQKLLKINRTIMDTQMIVQLAVIVMYMIRYDLIL